MQGSPAMLPGSSCYPGPPLPPGLPPSLHHHEMWQQNGGQICNENNVPPHYRIPPPPPLRRMSPLSNFSEELGGDGEDIARGTRFDRDIEAEVTNINEV